ncbi:hypothetical protein [Haliangium ochraceum]|uniref:Uncharacterized protein n=1 Tax=Haliangium ochraceum (strain DSM 14365 / JCM 11303 / SMP-2) TaxID=502025 RepID=D0LM70_HALO1|nr:hypothetical protein [Haliangium ochraceum]ACY16776.1 hypothetical protein Hoch_4279 [Haliangium ochraceum DSM 14365]
MSHGEQPARRHELPALAQRCDVDGIQFTARCYRVDSRQLRYEIILEGGGQIAIVDVPRRDGRILDQRIQQALTGFAATILSRRH